MSAPQPPADGRSPGDTDPDAAAPSSGTNRSEASYDFHGEKLDFDPYRFGAPEPATTSWPSAPTAAPGSDPGRPPAPGERWQPGQDAGAPPVRPGDYWGGAGSHRGTFPPAGYVPPANPADPTAHAGHGADATRVDLGKPDGGSTPAAPPAAPPAYPSPPPYGAPYGNQPAPGAYPGPPARTTGGGDGFAVAGLVVGIVACLLAITSWPGILVGVVGLVLAIIGLVRARRGGSGKGLAVTGVILSAVALVVSTVVLVVVLSRIDFDCVVNANGDTSQAQECIR